ncbi:MAG: PEP-CTERM sorting domain-containing protein [Alphaproteobacteria bacterium]
MNKKILFSTILLSALLLSLSSIALAKSAPTPYFSTGPYLSLDKKGENPSSIFGLDETPFVYSKVRDAVAKDGNKKVKFIMSWDWFYQDMLVESLSGSKTQKGKSEYTFVNSQGHRGAKKWEKAWDKEVAAGSWKVTTTWENAGYGGSEDLSFIVTPEPISTVLFLVGGLPLGASLLRKKFKV